MAYQFCKRINMKNKESPFEKDNAEGNDWDYNYRSQELENVSRIKDKRKKEIKVQGKRFDSG